LLEPSAALPPVEMTESKDASDGVERGPEEELTGHDLEREVEREEAERWKV